MNNATEKSDNTPISFVSNLVTHERDTELPVTTLTTMTYKTSDLTDIDWSQEEIMESVHTI